VNIAFITNRGAVRQENQDALCVAGAVRSGDMESPEFFDKREYPLLLAVIDGMGGYEGGAVAARIVAQTLSDGAGKGVFQGTFNRDADAEALRALLEAAALRMADEVRDTANLSKMGATVSGILLRENSALVFNCGDCRVYRISGGELERLTREHSIVQALFEKGVIDEDGMRSHPEKNVVTSAISADFAGVFDLYTRAVSRCEGDAFFICSDGVWESLSAQDLLRRLSSGFPNAARELFSDLIAARCRDNVSFIWQVE
jgi:protein phosphatase